MDDGHKFVKRIPTGGVDDNGKPINVKWICASEQTKRIHISTIVSLMAIDIAHHWGPPPIGAVSLRVLF
jgi:hypothetical protein